jgi:hypothetical protein
VFYKSFAEPIKDEKDSLKVVKYDYLFLSTKYQNAFTFIGRDFGQDLSLQTVDLIYYFSNGFISMALL